MAGSGKNIQQLIEENSRLKGVISQLESQLHENKLPDSTELLQRISSRYIDLYDNAPDMFFSVKTDGTILSVNQTGANHLGYKKEELIGKAVWKVVFKDDLDFVQNKIKDIVKNKRIKDELEFRKIRKDGSQLFVHERTKLVFKETGKVSEIRITCRDITDRKKFQTNLQAQEEKYRTLAINLNVGLYRSTADSTGAFLEVNPAFVKMLGYKSKKQLMLIPVTELYDNHYDRKALQNSLQNTGFVKNLEVRLKKKNGKTFIASISTVVSRDEKGRALYYDGIVEDITERKNIENAVKESELKYRTLFSFSPSGILIEDLNGIILEVNPSFCEMLDYSRDELIGMNVKKLAHPDVYKEVRRNIDDIVSGKQLKHIEKSLRKDGSIIYTELNESRIELSGGNSAILCIAEDISDRILAEEALIESEQKYRLLIEHQSDLVVKVDTEGHFLFVSPSYCELFGRKEEDLIGNDFIQLVHKDDRKATKEAMKKLSSPPYNVYVEQRASTKFGWRWIAWMLTAILDNQQRVTEIIGVGRDITERKIAEEALLKSEESYRGLFNSTTDAIYIQDKQGRFVDVNDGAVKMYGYPREYFIGKTPEFLSAPDKNDNKNLEEYITKAFNGEPQFIEFWGIDSKGRAFPKEVKLNKGSYFGKEVVVAFAEDVTERKKAEQVIKESERRLSTLMGNLQGMAYRCKNDKDWTMEFVSMGCYDLTGYDPLDLIGNNKISFNEIIYLDDRDSIWDQIQIALNEKKSFRTSYRIVTANGKIRWVLEQGIGVYSSDGELIALEGFISNITDQKEAEDEVRKLSRSVEQSPTIIIITDLNANIEYVNPQFTKTTGYSLEEVIGKNPNLLKSGNTPKKTYEKLWDLIRNGKEWAGEFENKRKNGEHYWELANIFPLKDDKGNLTHFIAMKEDITERKKMEGELITAKDRAEESDNLKSAFLANMSHEIRTPMNAIIGFSQLLDETGISSSERSHYISLIQNSGNDLMNLIDDIIDISKIEAGQMKVSKSNYFLHTILQSLHENFKELLKTNPEKQHFEIIYNRNENLFNEFIYTDIDRFKQIFKNLLNNAIKFTEKGKVEFGFETIDEIENPQYRFYVKDTGKGIPQNKMKIIFESFTQVNQSDTKLYGGTGLGLAITKKIVTILGGEIWVESELGRGSTFFFTLPRLTSTKQEKQNIQQSGMNIKANYNWKNKVVLVVEDDNNSFIFISSIFKKTGVSVERALDGNDALEQVRNKHFDLVLMDIRIPKMDGYVTTSQIRKINSSVPIIAHTAYAMENERNNCLKAGCNDYISKPVIISDFLETLSRYL